MPKLRNLAAYWTMLMLCGCSIFSPNETVGTDSGGSITTLHKWLQNGIILHYSIPLETFHDPKETK